MENQLQQILIHNFILENATVVSEIKLTYQSFGKAIGTAPLVLVNHALTGNSHVTGANGWWSEIIGNNKAIDTNTFTVLAFNIPGNGYLNTDNHFENYKDFTVHDIAKLFWQGLEELNITNVFAAIGGSLGGAIAWHMAIIKPNHIQNLLPVATSWKASDWLIGNVLIQDLILNNSNNPVHDARIHAMLLYRTPESLQAKFQNQLQENTNWFQVESWLNHHGEKLKGRFQLSAYKLMNHLLRTIDVLQYKSIEEIALTVKSNIHLISVDTDYFFTAKEIRMCYNSLKENKENVFYHEIKSIHGHDAFLIENQQLNNILKPVFTIQ